MRKLTILLALMGAVACDQANINETSPPAPDTVVLSIGDAPASYHDLDVWFTEVPEDSRCPTDVTCVWEGNARVVLNTVVGGVERVLALNTAADPEIGNRTARIDGYRLTLLALEPAPLAGAPIPTGAYVVTLEVALR